MKLDDRPVIDQLLNPTPLNIVREVEGFMYDRISDGEVGLRDPIQTQVDDALKHIRENLAGTALLHFDEAVSTLVVLAAADETDRRWHVLQEFANEIEARL